MLFLYIKRNDDPKPPPSVTEGLRHFFSTVSPRQSLLQESAPAKAAPKPLSEGRMIFSLPVSANGSNAHQLAEMRIRQWVLQQEIERRKRHGRPLPIPGR